MPKRIVNTIVIIFMVLVGVVIGSLIPRNRQADTPTAVPATLTSIPSFTPIPKPCDPLSASTNNDIAVLTMPDGSMIYLGVKSKIEIIPAGFCPGSLETIVTLQNGLIAVRSAHPGETVIQVTNPRGFFATIDDTGLVSYDPAGGIFTMDCTNGNCSMGPDLKNMIPLACGESGRLNGYLAYHNEKISDTSRIDLFGDWLLPRCVQVSTRTPPAATATPDLAATATASCAIFNDQFPLTPCPSPQP